MPTTIPALRGNFGSTEYWVTTMSVGELLRNVQFPQDITDSSGRRWDDLSIEEKYQREVNLQRVRKQIAPYFACDPNRFSGSLVLAVINDDQMVFEPLPNIGGGGGRNNVIPQLYQSAARDIGFLTLQGDEILVPLDGQHRVKAFGFAINGTDDNNRQIAGIKGNQELARDQVAVILVRFKADQARRIFNNLNRYAKPTNLADNLITDDDDALAVMTRELLGESGVIPSRLVQIRTNTLTNKAHEFTTLGTFYDSNTVLVTGLRFFTGKGSVKQMPQEQRELVKENIKLTWEHLLSKVDLWAKSLADPSEKGDKTRIQIREDTLLGKPIGQLSLIRGYLIMRERCEGVSEDDLCERINQIDWSVKNKMWEGVLMNRNERVMAGRGTVNRACEFIAHLGGAKLTDEETKTLLEHIYGSDGQKHNLPDPVA